MSEYGRVRIVAVVGNPRAASRTHGIARTLAREVAAVLGAGEPGEVDLATLGSKVLEREDRDASAAVEEVLAADVLVVASPTYKATYSGLLKAFLDRIGTGGLHGTRAVPVLLGGAPDHRLAVDVHFTPLLLELGASVPARGLFVLESELDDFDVAAAAWARDARAALLAAS
jgi:FMN reductase